jgi:Carbohydrate binding module (family 6).
MKNRIFILLSFALILALTMATASFAAAVRIECEDFEQYGGEQVGGANIQEAAVGNIIGSKPDEVGTDCYTSYNLEITEHGIYTFKISYSAPESADNVRKGDISINGARQPIPVVPTPDWDTYAVVSVSVELDVGTATIQILSPSDYDDSTVKTCNFDWIEYELTEKIETVAVSEPEAVNEAPAAVTAPVNTAPQQAVTAPATADYTVVFVILAILSAAAVTLKQRNNI